MPHQRETRNIQSSEFAIKPASHTTERHSMNCLMAHSDRSTSTYHTPPCQRNESFKNCNAYSGFNSEMRATVAQPAKIYREPAEFETWRAKIDEVIEKKIIRCKRIMNLIVWYLELLRQTKKKMPKKSRRLKLLGILRRPRLRGTNTE